MGESLKIHALGKKIGVFHGKRNKSLSNKKTCTKGFLSGQVYASIG